MRCLIQNNVVNIHTHYAAYNLTTIEQFYRDTAFTYFGRKGHFALINFFRVKNDELKDLNYEDFDRNYLREKFIADVVPESDMQKVQEKKKMLS